MGADVSQHASPKSIVALVDADVPSNDLRLNGLSRYELLETFEVCVTANKGHAFVENVAQLVKPELLSKRRRLMTEGALIGTNPGSAD